MKRPLKSRSTEQLLKLQAYELIRWGATPRYIQIQRILRERTLRQLRLGTWHW